MTDNEIIKAWDILAKLDFFGGQRAGRELWFEKPVDIQDEDIRNFSNDVAFLKDFIDRQKAEIERLKGNALKFLISDKTPSRYFKVKSQQPILIYPYEETKIELVPTKETIKAEAIKEFAERLVHTLVINNEENTEFFDFLYTLDTIDNLVKEMIGAQE